MGLITPTVVNLKIKNYLFFLIYNMYGDLKHGKFLGTSPQLNSSNVTSACNSDKYNVTSCQINTFQIMVDVIYINYFINKIKLTVTD